MSSAPADGPSGFPASIMGEPGARCKSGSPNSGDGPTKAGSALVWKSAQPVPPGVIVGPREKVIVIGPSGCRKSTLLKAVAGFIHPVAGEITVAGRSTLAPGPDRSVVFQEFDQLFPWRTVLDNVA